MNQCESQMENLKTRLNENKDAQETLSEKLIELEENSKNFVECVKNVRSDSGNHIAELSCEISKLQESIQNSLDPVWQQIKDGMFDAKCQLKEKEDELKQLKIEFQNQENAFMKIYDELRNIKTILFHQSSYTATLGATLCGLLWKASRKPSTVIDFLNGLLSCSMKSFFDTFNEHLPGPQSTEGQFVLSITGIIANIAAVPEGRKFLLMFEEGEQCIQEMLKMVSQIPPTGFYIKKMMLMALFNVSLDKRGNSIIEKDEFLLPMLMKNIYEETGELRYISLKLLQSLAFDIGNQHFLEVFINAIQSIKLEQMEHYCTEDEKNIIFQIIENVKSARLRLQNEENGNNKLYNGF